MHKMLIHSPQDDAGDTFGQVILVNGINGQQYVFDMMKDEDVDVEEQEIYASIYLSGYVRHVDFTDIEATRNAVGDAMERFDLADLIVSDAYAEAFQMIMDYERGGSPYFYDVSLDKLRIEPVYLLVDEEVTRLIFAIFDDTLTAKDVVDFGRLLCMKEDGFERLTLGYFAKPFEQVLKDVPLDEIEQKYIEKVMHVIKRSL